MRRLTAGLLAAGLILLLFSFGAPARAAYEEPQPPGQIVRKFVGVAYFQVWRHSDGRWQDTDHDGKPDRPGELKTWDHTAAGGLANLGSGWWATGARVRFLDAEEWTHRIYSDYGGYRNLTFTEFKTNILRYSAGQCREGRVWAEERGQDFVLHYEGIRLANQPGVSDEAAAKRDAMNLKKPKNRAFLQSLGIPFALPTGASFAEMAEGYIWWVPYLVEVYGVPDKGVSTPNFYVKDFDPGCPKDASGGYVAEAGKRYTATVTFGARDMWQDGTRVFPAVASVAGLHRVGSRWYRAVLTAGSGGSGSGPAAAAAPAGGKPSGLNSRFTKLALAGGLDGPGIPWSEAVAAETGQEGGARLVAGTTSDGQQLAYFEADGSELRLKFTWTAEAAPETVVGAAINIRYPKDSPVIRPVWWEGGSPPSFTSPVPDADIARLADAVLAVLEGSQSFVFNDNVVTVKVRIASPDFYVKSLDPGTSEVEEGQRYTGTVVYGLKGTVSGPVQAKLELTHNGYPVPGVNGQLVTLNPGEEKAFTFNFTGQDRDSVLEAKIRPVEGQDADWSDNSRRITVPLRRVQAGPGSLTFQAVSLSRTKTRPPNTAKWTDWVTATLRPPAPVPPRGTLDWWRVTSATLTYPAKNPKFTFGCPLPPQGTRTVSMKPALYEDGYAHGATAEFQEDWALDGARVYCVLTKQVMAEEPKYYTITAQYTIEYQYTYVVCDEDDCYEVTEQATTGGAVSGRLLVNGSGVNILSQ